MKRTHLGLAVLGLAVAAVPALAATKAIALKPGVYEASSTASSSTCSTPAAGSSSSGYIDLAAVGATGSTDTVPNLAGAGTAEYVLISTPAVKGINGTVTGEAYVYGLAPGGVGVNVGPVTATFTSTAVDVNTAYGTQVINIIDPVAHTPCTATLALTLVRVGK